MYKKRKTIAILGVDGSGKSTAVENLSKIYGDACSITYMGFTRFEDPRIDRLNNKRFGYPRILILVYLCFWKRYLRALQSGEFAIFDRYVHEVFINMKRGWWYNEVSRVLYKYLFPMPQKIVYLFCDAELSLKRKSDIKNPEVFMAMKKRFDDYFLNKKNVLCLDSGVLSPSEITEKIRELIDQSFRA